MFWCAFWHALYTIKWWWWEMYDDVCLLIRQSLTCAWQHKRYKRSTVRLYCCYSHHNTQLSCHTASMWRRASGVRVVTSSLTLTASRASFRRVTRNVAKRDAIPTQPPPPPPLQPLLLLVLPRSSNEPEPEILAYDDWRRGDRYEKLSRNTTTVVNEIL